MFPAMWVRYNMGWTEMLLIDIPLFARRPVVLPLLHGVAARAVPRLADAAEVPAVPDVDRHRPVGEQHARRARGAVPANRASSRARRSHGIERDSDEWAGKKCHQTVGVQSMIELALGLYFTGTVFYALINQIYGTLPFLMLFQIGFLYTGLLSILQQFTGDERDGPKIAGSRRASRLSLDRITWL